MTIEVFMPALSPTMETGNLASWLVKEGDTVTSGDVIAEIETDKATMEVESIDDGVVGRILVEAGAQDVPVGTLIAVLLEEDEDESALEAVVAQASSPAAAPVAAPAVDTPPAPVVVVAPAGTAVPQHAGNNDDRIKASPLARRMAKQMGLDLATIGGSGPKGRIVKRDIEAAAGTTPAVAPAAAPSAGPGAAPVAVAGPVHGVPDIPHTEIRLSTMRKTIARRLTESKQTVPHFYLTVDCEVDRLLAQRKELNAKLANAGIKLSVNDFIIRAVGLALKSVPAANVMFAGDVMYQFERADISVAVAIDGGLITPVIKGACGKGLAEISTEMKDLAARAREGKLAPDEYQGGTISISNLGMYGIKQFDAVINPPQAAILAVGAGEPRAVIRDGAVAAATVMTCTLSCDHRAIDGAVGSEFLSAFKGLIEDPLTMLL